MRKDVFIPNYDWSCQRCKAMVSAGNIRCLECDCPSEVSAAELAGETEMKDTPASVEPFDRSEYLFLFIEAIKKVYKFIGINTSFVGFGIASYFIAALAFYRGWPDDFEYPLRIIVWIIVYLLIGVPTFGAIIVLLKQPRRPMSILAIGFSLTILYILFTSW